MAGPDIILTDCSVNGGCGNVAMPKELLHLFNGHAVPEGRCGCCVPENMRGNMGFDLCAGFYFLDNALNAGSC